MQGVQTKVIKIWGKPTKEMVIKLIRIEQHGRIEDMPIAWRNF